MAVTAARMIAKRILIGGWWFEKKVKSGLKSVWNEDGSL